LGESLWVHEVTHLEEPKNTWQGTCSVTDSSRNG